MHLSDDEYDVFKPKYANSYRLKRSTEIQNGVLTISIAIVVVIFVMIYAHLKVSRVIFETKKFNQSYVSFINESIYEGRRFRMEVINNLSLQFAADLGVTRSMNKSVPGLPLASNRVVEMYRRYLNAPISNFIFDHNVSNAFYGAKGNSDDHMQLIENYRNFNNTCQGIDWVSCDGNVCQVLKEILDTMPMISCYYRDIIYVNDNYYELSSPVLRVGNETYSFLHSDHVKIVCDEFGNNLLPFNFDNREYWTGLKSGFRPVHVAVPTGRENSPDVVILALDSIPHKEFRKYLPQAYKVLIHELGAVVLRNYNANENITLTSFNPVEKGGSKLSDVQKRNRKIYLYPDNSLFTHLHDDGYHTAYLTDFPMVSSRSYKLKMDYHLTHFFEENEKMMKPDELNNTFSDLNCVGDTPKYVLLMNLTDQFMNIPVFKHFSFTLISNITNYPRLSFQNSLIYFLRSLESNLENTLFILITNQIFQIATNSSTMAEDHQLVFIVMPYMLREYRPEALELLNSNIDAPITPIDIDMTILDVLGLDYLINEYNMTDTELPKGRSLLDGRINEPELATSNPIPPTS